MFENNTYEVIVDTKEARTFSISLREDCVLSYNNGIFKLSLGKSGYGRDERAVEIKIM